jgi:hypothetical protein
VICTARQGQFISVRNLYGHYLGVYTTVYCTEDTNRGTLWTLGIVIAEFTIITFIEIMVNNIGALYVRSM